MKQGICLHHSAIRSPDYHGLNLGTMATNKIHLEARDVKSLAEYNFVVPKSGMAFPLIANVNGRLVAWNKESKPIVGMYDVNVGHCNDGTFNEITYGICCDGFYHFENGNPSETMPSTQFQGLLHCLTFLFVHSKIDHITTIIGTRKNEAVEALTCHNKIVETSCPGNNFPFEAIRRNMMMILRPRMLIFQLGQKIVQEYMHHYPKQNTIGLTKEVFSSDGSSWILAKDARMFGLEVPKESINPNGFVRLRTLATIFNYALTWEDKTKEITLRRNG